MSYSCHRRLLPSDYADGVKAIRRSVTGQDLPNSRLLSNVLLPDVPEVNDHLSQMVMQWGQSIVHDQTRTPIALGESGVAARFCLLTWAHIARATSAHLWLPEWVVGQLITV